MPLYGVEAKVSPLHGDGAQAEKNELSGLSRSQCGGRQTGASQSQDVEATSLGGPVKFEDWFTHDRLMKYWIKKPLSPFAFARLREFARWIWKAAQENRG
jgi:hypothetical protein